MTIVWHDSECHTAVFCDEKKGWQFLSQLHDFLGDEAIDSVQTGLDTNESSVTVASE